MSDVPPQKNSKKSFLRKWVTVTACALALFLLLYLVFTGISIVSFGNIDQKEQADAAIVLGAGASDSAVSAVYRERIHHGIWLYENGYADYLILTGGIGQGNTLSDAYVAKQYAISRGVPEDVIFIEELSTITEENLENAKVIMDDHSMDTAIIVSDPLHMKRAMLMAKDYGISACSSPTPTSMYRSLKTKIPFLLREEFFYIGYSIVRLFR